MYARRINYMIDLKNFEYREMLKMTKKEKIIISAYTGYLMCDFNDVHKYIEEKLGRLVYTHELTKISVQDEIQEKTRDNFLLLCGPEISSVLN